ncbi:MAG: hypothetical protein FWC10_02080 [Lentimicrobiaceae bacterium]|nr:hypothetical protein [Lentimicrobiaceae bacterium]
MKKSLILAVIALTLCLCYSCKQARYIPVETTKTEYHDKLHRDSVYLYDSVYVKEKGDTLIMERYRYLFRDKLIRDSIHINDTIRVPYPVEVAKQVRKPLTGWQNFQIWCGRIALVAVLFLFLFFVLKLKKKWLF